MFSLHIMNFQDAAVVKNATGVFLESRETSSRDIRRYYSYFSGMNETHKQLKNFKGS